MVNHPPYTINNEMLGLVAAISTKVGQVLHYRDMSAYPRLRRNNRIESIHSSLAIEANSLTLGNVRDVIAGKAVAGPEREILEVKNAYAAYEELPRLNPYSQRQAEMLRYHCSTAVSRYITSCFLLNKRDNKSFQALFKQKCLFCFIHAEVDICRHFIICPYRNLIR